MAQPKKKETVIVKHKRGADFQCSKMLKLMRGYMSASNFKTMIKNEKSSSQIKKAKSSKAD